MGHNKVSNKGDRQGRSYTDAVLLDEHLGTGNDFITSVYSKPLLMVSSSMQKVNILSDILMAQLNSSSTEHT